MCCIYVSIYLYIYRSVYIYIYIHIYIYIYIYIYTCIHIYIQIIHCILHRMLDESRSPGRTAEPAVQKRRAQACSKTWKVSSAPKQLVCKGHKVHIYISAYVHIYIYMYMLYISMYRHVYVYIHLYRYSYAEIFIMSSITAPNKQGALSIASTSRNHTGFHSSST